MFLATFLSFYRKDRKKFEKTAITLSPLFRFLEVKRFQLATLQAKTLKLKAAVP